MWILPVRATLLVCESDEKFSKPIEKNMLDQIEYSLWQIQI